MLQTCWNFRPKYFHLSVIWYWFELVWLQHTLYQSKCSYISRSHDKLFRTPHGIIDLKREQIICCKVLGALIVHGFFLYCIVSVLQYKYIKKKKTYEKACEKVNLYIILLFTDIQTLSLDFHYTRVSHQLRFFIISDFSETCESLLLETRHLTFSNNISIRQTCDFIFFDRSFLKQLRFTLVLAQEPYWTHTGTLHIWHGPFMSFIICLKMNLEIYHQAIREVWDTVLLLCVSQAPLNKRIICVIFHPKEKQFIIWWFNYSLSQCWDYPIASWWLGKMQFARRLSF